MASVDAIRGIRSKGRAPSPVETQAAKAVEEQAAAAAEGREPALDEASQAALAQSLAMLEIGFLVAAADGTLDDAELDNLAGNFGHWLGVDVPPDLFEDTLAAFSDDLANDGFEARLTDAAARVGEAAQGAYAFACVIGAANGDVTDEELDLLGGVAAALGVPEDEAQATFESIAQQIADARAQG